MTADPFDNPQTSRPTWEQDERGIWRNWQGRPGILVPGGGTKRVPYSRASSMGAVLDDAFAISAWEQRGVAVGLRRDRDSRGLLLSEIPNDMPEERDDKDALNEIVEQAKAAAGLKDKADHGTYLHWLCESFDTGRMTHEEYLALPEADRRDLSAYVAACREWGITHLHREAFMVNDARKIAGTPDSILEVDPRLGHATFAPNNLLMIGDLKTGECKYSALEWHMQLAAYAESTLYDPVLDERLATPEINQDWALVIHLPAGTATVNLVLIDLAWGRELLDLAGLVREARNRGKRKGAMPVLATYELPEEIDA